MTTKTDVQAEIAGGRDVLSPFVASPRAIRFMRTVPTHVIMGERQDFWCVYFARRAETGRRIHVLMRASRPKPVRNFISAIINENRPNLASVATVSKAGHYVRVWLGAAVACSLISTLWAVDPAGQPRGYGAGDLKGTVHSSSCISQVIDGPEPRVDYRASALNLCACL